MKENSHTDLTKASGRWLTFTIFFNAILAGVKGIVGVLGNSSALVADAVESVADVFSSIMVYIGLQYAQKPPDKEHPYGHGRIESVTTFVTVGILIVAAGLIIYNSVQNLFQEKVVPAAFTLYVLIAIIILKQIFYRISKNYAKKINSTSMMADAEHHRSDAIVSIAAFIGISIALIFGEKFAAADEIAAIVAACIIIYNAYRLFQPAYREIMAEQTFPELEKEIAEQAVKVTGVLATEKCYIRKMGMKFYVDLHIIVDGDISVRDGHTIAHSVKQYLKSEMPTIGNILIHVEPEEELERM